MANDWDLYAVIRGCTATNKNNNTATGSNKTGNLLNLDNSSSSNNIINKNETWPKIHQEIDDENPLACLASLTFEQENDPFGFPGLLEANINTNNNLFEELEEFFKPFYNPPSPPPPPSPHQDVGVDLAPNTPSPTMVSPINPHLDRPFAAGINGGNNDMSVLQVPQSPQPQQAPQFHAHGVPLVPFHPPTRPRKRKSQQKKAVCLVTAENLSSDMWAWRKYGQKPIKGSPYPRNYYRCSSSKGCSAKKQVERSIVEPSMFTVSYTGDHNHPRPTHRNSLAGSTRSKFNPLIAPKPESNGVIYFPAQALSPTTPLLTAPVLLTQRDGTNNMDIDEKSGSQEFAEMVGENSRENNGSSGDDDDDDDDKDNSLLIPNRMAMDNNEDIFLRIHGFGGRFGPSPPSSSSPSTSADTFSGSH